MRSELNGGKLLLSADIYRSAICAGAEPPVGGKCAAPLPAFFGDSKITVPDFWEKMACALFNLCVVHFGKLRFIPSADGRLREELPPATLFPAESPLIQRISMENNDAMFTKRQRQVLAPASEFLGKRPRSNH